MMSNGNQENPSKPGSKRSYTGMSQSETSQKQQSTGQLDTTSRKSIKKQNYQQLNNLLYHQDGNTTDQLDGLESPTKIIEQRKSRNNEVHTQRNIQTEGVGKLTPK